MGPELEPKQFWMAGAKNFEDGVATAGAWNLGSGSAALVVGRDVYNGISNPINTEGFASKNQFFQIFSFEINLD